MVVKIIQKRLLALVHLRRQLVRRPQNHRRTSVRRQRLQRVQRNQMLQLPQNRPFKLPLLLQTPERRIHNHRIGLLFRYILRRIVRRHREPRFPER